MSGFAGTIGRRWNLSPTLAVQYKMNRHRRIPLGFMFLVAVVASACGRFQGNAGTGDIEYSRGPDDVILRVEEGGIFGPLAWSFRALPSFSLFGDGRMIVPGPRVEAYPAPLLQALAVRRVSDEGIQAILRAAREAGLQGPDRRFETTGVADAGATTFTVATDGRVHVTVASALGELAEQDEAAEYVPAGDREARRALLDFTARLSRLGEWLPARSIGEEEPFDPDRVSIFTNPYDSEEGFFLPPLNEDEPDPPLGALPELDWPLDEPIARFGEPLDGYQDPPILAVRCGSVEGDDLEAILARAEEASEFTPWLSDGHRYALVLRPLLPDNPDCPQP